MFTHLVLSITKKIWVNDLFPPPKHSHSTSSIQSLTLLQSCLFNPQKQSFTSISQIETSKPISTQRLVYSVEVINLIRNKETQTINRIKLDGSYFSTHIPLEAIERTEQQKMVFEKMKMKLEKEIFERVEDVVMEAKSWMKKMMCCCSMLYDHVSFE